MLKITTVFIQIPRLTTHEFDIPWVALPLREMGHTVNMVSNSASWQLACLLDKRNLFGRPIQCPFAGTPNQINFRLGSCYSRSSATHQRNLSYYVRVRGSWKT